MQFFSEKSGAVLVASLEGQLNSGNAADLEDRMLGLVETGEHQWVLDLSRLDYISSAGLRVVLMLAKRLRGHQGRLVLCRLQPQVHEVFDISGFLSILTAVGTREEAVSQLETKE